MPRKYKYRGQTVLMQYYMFQEYRGQTVLMILLKNL
jgi:hypothetical protein